MASLRDKNPLPEVPDFVTDEQLTEVLHVLGFENTDQVISLKGDHYGIEAEIIPNLAQRRHLNTGESGSVTRMIVRIPNQRYLAEQSGE